MRISNFEKKTHKFVKICKTSGNALKGIFDTVEIMSLQLSGVGNKKYGLRAFQRRIGRIHTNDGYDFRVLYTSIENN